jgi:hypothetical protein
VSLREFVNAVVHVVQSLVQRSREIDASELHVGATDAETMRRIEAERDYGQLPDVQVRRRER